MRRDPVILSQKEQQRLRVIAEVEAGRLEADLAAELLGLSPRQVRRLRRGYREGGANAFMHGNRSRPSPRRIPDEVRVRVVELARTQYAGCNDSHLAELLALREGIVLGRRAWSASARQRDCRRPSAGALPGIAAGATACRRRACCCR